MSMIPSKYSRRQNGASLIEVMVALLVLAIGMLGFAGMQTRGIQAGRQAFLHSQAAFLAEDMVERIRANAAQKVAYAMLPSDAGVNNHCDTTICSPANLRGWDQYMWQQRVGRTLPGGKGSITSALGSNAYATVTVQVTYTFEANGATADYKLQTQIN